MKMVNEAGQAVYYNVVKKRGQFRFVVMSAGGQTLPGRDREKLKSRTFSHEHQARAYLERLGYKAETY